MSATSFVKLPDALLYDPDLSDGALRAYMVLAGYARACSSDTFELTADALGTLLGRSRDQAERRLRELERRGLVVIGERHRGRARPNRITVLDPQGVVFAGLHVDRDAADVRQPDAADLRQPIYKEERTRADRGVRGAPLPFPVDSGPATPGPRPPSPPECPEHRGQLAHSCSPCRSERIEARGAPF